MPPEEQVIAWINRLANDQQTLTALQASRGWSAQALTALHVGLDETNRLVFPIRDADDHLIGLVHRSAAGADSHTPAGHKRGLFPAPEEIQGGELYVVEGEADAVAGATLGLPTTSVPGTSGWRAEYGKRIASRRDHVVIVCDADDQGRIAARRWATDIAKAGCPDVRIVDLNPDAADHTDLGDALRNASSTSDLRVHIQGLADVAPPAGVPHKTGRELRAVSMLGMKFEPIHWLWRNYLPLSKITLLAGVPGQGKSQLTCLIAALATIGELDAPAGDVLIVSAEDDPADTIAPRLAAAGADPARVNLLNVDDHHGDGESTPGVVMLPDDVRRMRKSIDGLKAPRLLVLDPVSAFLTDKADAHKNADVRRALAPLKQIAEDYKLAVLLVTHLNKGTAIDPLTRIADSGAFVALARGVLFLAPDPEDEDGDRGAQKILAIAKTNLAGSGHHSLKLRMASAQAHDDQGTVVDTSCIEVVGTSLLSASDLLVPLDERTALHEARLWLRDVLTDSWWPAAQIKDAAGKAGVSQRTLQRAREQICQRPRKSPGDRGIWVWALRGVPVTEEGLTAHLYTGARAQGARTTASLANLGGAGASLDNLANFPHGGRTREQQTTIDRMLGERDEDA